jgi:dihydroorotate dehydrogenase electron transfer subunit
LKARRHRAILLFGGRSKNDLVSLSCFRDNRVGIRLATEDGSAGVRGYVTRLLEPLLADAALRRALRLFVCGPTPMLGSVAAMAIDAGVPCQLALEAQMPCGIGVCIGCVVACPGPPAAPSGGESGAPVYRRVCTDGPIFEAGEVLF